MNGWNGEAWRIPAEYVELARSFMIESYGESDIDGTEKIKVRLIAKNDIDSAKNGIYFCGKIIVSAFGRDSGAKVCENVSLIDGSIDSGGSVKNWKTIIYKGTILEVSNVPKNLFEQDLEYIKKIYEVEILNNNNYDKINLLLKEKEKIQERLKEIENELNFLKD